MLIIAVLVGCVIGALSTWFIAQYKFRSEKGLSQEEIDNQYVTKALYTKLDMDLVAAQKEVEAKNDEILQLNKDIASKDQIIANMNEKFTQYKAELENLQKRMTSEFENIATRVLENRSQQFLETSKVKISSLLTPLEVKIQDFKTRVDQIYSDDSKERASLKSEIKNLMDLNRQVSDDANNLANALKGESKIQGNWGENHLQMILERVGLIKGVHFRMQESFETENGKRVQPDCIVNLPDNKHLIIDSKVSLVAFERYFNSATEAEKADCARQHLISISGHIRELSRKNYQQLYQINPPDYVLMFIPYESALALAIKEDVEIWQQALEKNIVLVTGSTLLATLKTIAYIWKQENQKKHVLEIAKQGGALYDKFVLFIEDLKKIGLNIEQTRLAYEAAMNKLTLSSKRGDTLIGRAERIRELGAKTSKVIPPDMLDKVAIEEQVTTQEDLG